MIDWTDKSVDVLVTLGATFLGVFVAQTLADRAHDKQLKSERAERNRKLLSLLNVSLTTALTATWRIAVVLRDRQQVPAYRIRLGLLASQLDSFVDLFEDETQYGELVICALFMQEVNDRLDGIGDLEMQAMQARARTDANETGSAQILLTFVSDEHAASIGRAREMLLDLANRLEAIERYLFPTTCDDLLRSPWRDAAHGGPTPPEPT